MERNQIRQLAPELWSHILSFIEDFDVIIKLKFVNRIFYQELGSRDPFKAFDRSINISQESLQYFLKEDKSVYIPRDELLDALRRKLVANEGAIKTTLVGKEKVGKTSFFNYFMRGADVNIPGVTISSFVWKKLVDPDGVTAKFELWDTVWKESHQPLSPMYYRAARALLLCFSLDSRDSLVSLLNTFVPLVTRALGSCSASERPVTYLLGLKSDLARQISTSEAKAIARALKVKYFECSSRLGQNINEIMNELKDDVLRRCVRLKEPPVSPSRCSVQ